MARLLRGHVGVSGLWFAPGSVNAARVLAACRPGSTLSVVRGGILLRLLVEVHLACATAPALPLVARGGVLSSVSDSVSAEAGSVVLLWRGRVEVVPAREIIPLDVGPWLDLGTAEIVTVSPLGPPPLPAPAPAGFDVRVALRRPPSGKEAEALRTAILAGGRKDAGPLARAGAGLGAWLLGLLGGGASAGTGAGSGAGSGGGVAGGTAGADRMPGPPPEPSAFAKALRRLAAPLWGPLLGGAHGRYLAKIFELFDAGKLEEALRHAIPLGGDGGPSLGPAWSLPSPRAGLGLGTMVRMPSTSIGLEGDLFQHLRQLYERALQKLLAEKRFDEAVFILVELLREYQRAVDLLEREGRFDLAAQIAEANLAPAVAIRLWMLAGKPDKAVLHARRMAAFAEAVALLRGKEPALAISLRRTWAEHLAARGDFAGACTVAWEEPLLRSDAVVWLDDALAAGGPSGARLIAYLLDGSAGAFAAAKERVEALLPTEGCESVAMRIAAANGLDAVATPEARTLLRPLFRRLVADQFATPEFVGGPVLQRVKDRLAEPALVADQPSPNLTSRHLRQRTEPLRYVISAADAGTIPIHDLCFHPDSGLLVAVGELGVRHYSQNGRVRATFDEPAHALVSTTAGAVAFGVARRDWGVRLSRLDIRTGEAERWHDARYTKWSNHSDGNLWFVAEDDSLVALDALAPEAKSLWRVNRLPAAVERLSVGSLRFSALLGGKDRERWVHSLAGMRLSERRRTPASQPVEWLGPDGLLHVIEGPRLVGTTRQLSWQEYGNDESILRGLMLAADVVPVGQTVRTVAVDMYPGSLSMRLATFGDGSNATVVLWLTDIPILVVELSGAKHVGCRLSPEYLCIGDDRGRALVIELASGTRIRDVRVGSSR